MAVGWQIYSEAREVGKAPATSTLDYPDEEAAREEFGAFRRRIRHGGPERIDWTIELRHDGQVIDEFRGTQGPSTT
jgi:hypothetical protein